MCRGKIRYADCTPTIPSNGNGIFRGDGNTFSIRPGVARQSREHRVGASGRGVADSPTPPDRGSDRNECVESLRSSDRIDCVDVRGSTQGIGAGDLPKPIEFVERDSALPNCCRWSDSMSLRRGYSALTSVGLTAVLATTTLADGDRWFPRIRRSLTSQQGSQIDAPRQIEAPVHPRVWQDELFQTVQFSPRPAPEEIAPEARESKAPPASSTVAATAAFGEARPFPGSIVPVSGETAEPLLSPVALADDEPIPELAPVSMTGLGYQLDQFEQLALTHHPTLAQLSATVNKANALRSQVQTYPNPIVGYSAQQLADRETDQHMAFVQQQIVLGNKLRLNANVLGHASNAQSWELEAQRCRVLTDVRLRYYEALVAQERLRLSLRLQRVAEKGVAEAEQRRALVDASELLQTEIQLQEIQVIREQAKVEFRAAWQGLAAAAGVPAMAAPEVADDEQWSALAGQLLPPVLHRDWDAVYSSLITCSPEIQAARGRVQQASANLTRQQAQPIPNLDVNFGAGYDNSTNSQMINVQVGAPVPLFNKNRGNISAAYAEYCRAVKDVERLELALKSRLADAAREFDSAVIAVERYNGAILPRARENLQLTEQRIAAIGDLTDFIPLIIARRTLFETELEYVRSQGNLAQATARLDGFLLSGGLEATVDLAADDGLRGQTLDGQ